MSDSLAPNARAHPYRSLSVQEVDIPLTAADVRAHLLGREVYRRTEFLVLRHGEATALVWVAKAAAEPLFSPVTELTYLAGPDEIAWVDAPDVDVGNATAMAAAVRTAPPGRAAYVVCGRHEHVNFLWRPQPLRVCVTEVVPPEPPKLLDQARQAVAFDEDLPPIELELDAVRIADLVADHPAPAYLLPCRGCGVEMTAPLSFLDTRPAERGDWTLIGCERSRQFHEHFYGDAPPQVDLCPLARLEGAGADGSLALAKCCLWERGVEMRGRIAVVPWGANLDEVRSALRQLVGLEPVASPTVTASSPPAGR